MFSGGAIVNWTTPGASAPAPDIRSTTIAVPIKAMVASAATSHAIRLDRAGADTVVAALA